MGGETQLCTEFNSSPDQTHFGWRTHRWRQELKITANRAARLLADERVTYGHLRLSELKRREQQDQRGAVLTTFHASIEETRLPTQYLDADGRDAV